MKNILKFIYDKKDEGIYRKRIIFGIRIITKPIELRLNSIEQKISLISDYTISNNILIKLKVYEIYSKNKESSYKNKIRQ